MPTKTEIVVRNPRVDQSPTEAREAAFGLFLEGRTEYQVARIINANFGFLGSRKWRKKDVMALALSHDWYVRKENVVFASENVRGKDHINASRKRIKAFDNLFDTATKKIKSVNFRSPQSVFQAMDVAAGNIRKETNIQLNYQFVQKIEQAIEEEFPELDIERLRQRLYHILQEEETKG